MINFQFITKTFNKPTLLLWMFIGFTALNACNIENTQEVTGNIAECINSESCSEGNVCSGGICVAGRCDPAVESQCDLDSTGSRCCKAWENCNGFFQCERDPNAEAIGCSNKDENDASSESCVPCGQDEDCPTIGQFCYGGQCLETANRTDCTQALQCANDERCDRTMFLCVPNKGGCQYCLQFPELCCDTTQQCNEETGFCIRLTDDAACTADNVAEVCNPGQKCSDGRCVQCTEDSECGSGLACNEAAGTCYSIASICEVDDDCTGRQRCVSNQCITPQCTDDYDCKGLYECNVETYQCVLPPPECDEDDEPNDGFDSTTILDASTYTSTLCRGNNDYMTFSVQPGKRYEVTIQADYETLAASLYNTSLTIEDQFSGFIYSDEVLIGSTSLNESGVFTLILQGIFSNTDQITYTVSIEETDSPSTASCGVNEQPEEPNNRSLDATLIHEGTHSFSRCDIEDVDFYKMEVPALQYAQVTLNDFINADGNLNLEIYNADGNLVDSSLSSSNVEEVQSLEGPQTFYVKVYEGSSSWVTPPSEQGYTLTIEYIARPSSCSGDIGEPNGSASTATPLSMISQSDGSYSVNIDNAILCTKLDLDYYRYTVPAGFTSNIGLEFNGNEGDLDLAILDTNGVLLYTATSSSVASPFESLSLSLSSSERNFIIRVISKPGTEVIAGMHYSLSLANFDNSSCLLSEPTSDDTFSTGRCLGNFSSSLSCVNDAQRGPMPLSRSFNVCETSTELGCGRTCGSSDTDIYRLGPMSTGQIISTSIAFTPSEGNLRLVLLKRTSTGVVSEIASILDNDGLRDLNISSGVIEYVYLIPSTSDGSEYAIKISPQGGIGFQAQPYALSANVTAACVADNNDSNGLSNATPATSTIISRSVSPFSTNLTNLSICPGDVDVYELQVTDGESISVSASGLPLTHIEIGTRPANQNNPAIMQMQGDGNPASAQWVATGSNGRVYITVKNASNATEFGAYSLQINVQ
jgi:hypothetical protein